MRVSIIIPAFNAEQTIAECLEACLRQTWADCEIIVVDDGSTDRTGEIVQSFDRTGRTDRTDQKPICNLQSAICNRNVLYFRQANKGPAAARNAGAAKATGDVLAFTDSDCVPRPDWIERLLEGFAEGVVGVGGTYAIANKQSLLARMVHEEIMVRHELSGENVDFLGSFNVSYLRSAFEAAGGFDESFSNASAEDNDLSYRLIDKGGRLRFRPQAVVAHYHPTRLWPYLKTQARHGYWRMKLYKKHPRRAKTGDQYASALDLTAPPLALTLCAAVPAMSVGAWQINAAAVLLALTYAFVRAPLAQRMYRRSGDARMLYFGAVALLRDAARGLGMIGGVAHFFVLKRA
jgi:glycosyltransferase involved in cell wall biosynthesis